MLEWVITDNEVWKCSCAFLRQCEQALVIHQRHAKKQLASHCLYSWFLANGLSHCDINCAEFRSSLPITRSQNNNTHHNLHFLLFWQQSVHEEKKYFNHLFCYCLFFSPTCWGTGGGLALLQWEFATSLTGTLISQSVSELESYPINRFTSTDGSLSLHKMSVNDLQKVHFVNRLYQRLQVKEAPRISPGSNSSQH